MKRSLVIVSLLAALGTARSSAAAPTSVRDTLAAEPQARFDEGTRLYKDAELVRARESFMRAYESSGDARVLFNVAVCDKAMGRYARAIATLKKSVAGDQAITEDYRKRVNEALATLGVYVAPVRLDSSTPDTSFSVDGTAIAENPALLDVGTHTITASKDGFEAMSKSVTVRGGEPQELRFPLELSRRPGTVSVTCPSSPQCDVQVGEESIGKAPVTFRREGGTYLVRATAGGRTLAEKSVVVVNGTSVAIALEGRVVPLARLRVTTDHLDDLVSVDGRRAGTSGVELDLPAGEHRVLVARGAGPSRSMDVLLRENETRDLRFPLEEKEKKGSGVLWWITAGGVVVAGAIVTGVVLATRSTKFEGSSVGTLNPYVVTASLRGERP